MWVWQQIQHPTAQLISRAAIAQDDVVGDGTSSTVVFIGELLKQAQRYLTEGVHPRLIADGFDVAKTLALEYLEQIKLTKDCQDRELLTSIARSTLQTKVGAQLSFCAAFTAVSPSLYCCYLALLSMTLDVTGVERALHPLDRHRCRRCVDNSAGRCSN